MQIERGERRKAQYHRGVRSAVLLEVVLVGTLVSCAEQPADPVPPPFRFAAYAAVHSSVTEARVDGIVYPLSVDGAGRALMWERNYDDYLTAHEVHWG